MSGYSDSHHIPLHAEEAFGFHAFVWFRKKLSSNYLEKCNRLETKQLTKHTTHIWLDARTGVLRNWVQNMQWTWRTLFLCLLNLHSELISSVYARGVDLDRGILRSWHNCTHFNINCTQQGEYSPLRRYLRYSSFYADWVRVQIRAIRPGQTMGGWEAVEGGNKISRNIMQATSPCWGTLPV